MPATDPPWYVLCVEPNRDSRALLYLRRQGFEARCLTFRKRRRAETIEAQLFPGYLFLPDPVDRWERVLRTFSVVDVLRADGEPTPLPKDACDELFAMVSAIDKHGNALVHMDGPQGKEIPTLNPNTPVRVTDGTFLGFPARFLRRTARERVAVLLALFGRDTRVEIAAAQIEPLDG